MAVLLIRKAVSGGVLHKLDGEAYDFYVRRLRDFHKYKIQTSTGNAIHLIPRMSPE